jgi:glutathione S-transferase
MNSLTLTYFDIPVSRGEECRLALWLAGVPFNDERLTRPQFQERIASTPFGALPVLSAEGKPPLAQANAILRWVGSQYGLLPDDPWESARHEGVMGAVEDLRAKMGPINRLSDPEEKKKARLALASGFLPEWAAHVERQVGGPFVGGDRISVADLKLFVVMGPILNGKIDHVGADSFARFPKLTRLHEAVKLHPRVVSWYDPTRK